MSNKLSNPLLLTGNEVMFTGEESKLIQAKIELADYVKNSFGAIEEALIKNQSFLLKNMLLEIIDKIKELEGK